MKREVHRAFLEQGLDREDPEDHIEWFMARCHETHATGFAVAGSVWNAEEGQIQVALSWLNRKCDAEHIL